MVIGIALLLGVAQLLYANYCGLGLTADSYVYINASQDFAENGLISGLRSPDLHFKPPFYSLLLTVFIVEEGTLLLNIFCYAITIIINSWLAVQLIRSSIFRYLYLLLLVFGTPLLLVHSFVWSEPPFIALFSVVLGVLLLYLKKQKTVYIAAIGLLCILLFGLRHATIFLVLGLIISFFVFSNIFFKRVLPWLLMSILFFTAWVVFKSDGFTDLLQLLANPLVEREGGRYTSNILSFANGFSVWFFPTPIPVQYRAVALALLIVVIAYLYYQQPHSYLYHRFWQHTLSIFVVYYVGIHTVFTLQYFSSDAERYLAPFYPILLLFILSTLESQRTYRKLIIAALALFSLYPISRSLRNIHLWHQSRCSSTKTNNLINYYSADQLLHHGRSRKFIEGENQCCSGATGRAVWPTKAILQ